MVVIVSGNLEGMNEFSNDQAILNEGSGFRCHYGFLPILLHPFYYSKAFISVNIAGVIIFCLLELFGYTIRLAMIYYYRKLNA
jgi:hypothetical protein